MGLKDLNAYMASYTQ
ncbi:hypothetical protein RDI58_029007 [Solanum bulbocastanum]|uniref:Uncharacterized protein n=1 Tax=Solanum bulbocastanum TaxID=147425 RepID=A0AAN8XZJ1_SOLBU